LHLLDKQGARVLGHHAVIFDSSSALRSFARTAGSFIAAIFSSCGRSRNAGHSGSISSSAPVRKLMMLLIGTTGTSARTFAPLRSAWRPSSYCEAVISGFCARTTKTFQLRGR
jgi:hypothetical protein